MGWVERRWKQVVFIAALSATVVWTTAVAAPAVARVPGMDVSKYQGRIDWRAVATTPVRFAVLRATLGNDYRDGRFTRNVAGARRNGLDGGRLPLREAEPGPLGSHGSRPTISST